MKTIILSILVLISTSIFAQLNVTQAVTAAALVNSLTGGNNGTVSNIIYTGNANSCGTFTTGATATNLGISSGILLTSGKSSNAVGPNDVSDKGSSMAGAGFALLDALAGANTKDACVLQFDFVPINNTITFKYVFGSEEYHEYVNGGYNDAFAFFLTGPNPSGGNYTNQNIALVPSTTLPVSIDNVNNGVTSIMGDCTFGGPSGPCVNCAYFVNNCSGTSIQYDGFTKVLTATANVTPCQTYTIKLAIADASDYVYDSGVFIEQGSFTGITPPGIISYTGPICGGVPVDFTYTGAGTPGTWTFPGGTPSTGSGAGPIAVSWASNGNYTVDLSVNIGCNTNVTEDITVSSAAPTIGSNSPICAGQTLNLTSSGGGTYQWSGPDGFTSNLQNPSISNATLAADGTYYLTVTSAGGCISNTSTVVSISSAISPTASSNTPICSGNNLNLSASGGATYHWEYPDGITTSDSQNPSISNATTSASGTYSVTVTAASGCNAITTTNVTVNALPVVTINNSSPVCSATNVNLSCTPNGMSYNWSGPNSFSTTSQNPTITGATSINAGVYSLTVTDGNTCTSSTTTNVTVNSNPSVSITATNVSCYGLSDGAGTTTVTGGTSPFNYSWSNSTNSQNLTGVSAGNYLLTVTDANLCKVYGAYTVTQPAAALSATITPTAVKCNAGTDGSVSLTPSGGTTPYSFSWSNGANTEDLSNISANTYSVTITDNHACQYLTSTTVTQPLAPLSMTNTITDVKCKGDATGVIDITVADGTSPYSYIWSNSAITQDLNNVIAGNYAVTISDFNNCKFYNTLTVAEPTLALSISNTITDVLCNGNSTGAINVTTNGGTSPYTYSWTNGSNTEDISTIQSGNYALTATDANLCKVYGTYTVTQPVVALSATITPTAVKCNAGTDGSVSLTPSGGTTPYSFSWSNGANTEDLSNVSANTYSVTITDNHACQYLASTTVTQPLAPLSITSTITDVLCKNASIGAITISVLGGTPTYSYSWTGPSGFSSTTQNINSLKAGSYNITITDINNCKINSSLFINEPANILSLSVSSNVTICEGNQTNLTAQFNGGTSPYNYTWKDGNGNIVETNTSINNCIVNVSPTTTTNYFVYLTDNNGCTVPPKNIEVSVSNKINYSLTINNNLCYNSCKGSAKVNIISGGVAPYTYNWLNSNNFIPENNKDLLCKGINYRVEIKDSWGCTTDTTFNITEPSLLQFTSQSFPTKCFGSLDGTGFISPTGGTRPYTYQWNNVSSIDSIIITGAGTYNVTVYDYNNCDTTGTVTITQPLDLRLYPPEAKTVCKGQSTLLTSTQLGGTSPYTYTWTSPDGTIYNGNPINVNPINSSYYQVELTDANGCVKNSQTHVEVKPPLSLDMISDKYKICPADTIKLIANDVSGGLGFNYTLMLTDGTIITPEYEMIPENQDTTIWYYVTLSDNCTAEKAKDSVQVSIFPKPEIDFTSDIASGCPPQMIEFNFTTSDPLKKHYWDFGDNLNNYSTTNSVHSFDHSGMFDVTLSVVTNDGCKTSITKPEFINIYPTPKAIFSAEPSTASIINPEIEFLNYSESNLVNSWVFGDYDYSNDINPIHIYSEVGEYNVELIVKNEFECADTTSLPVFIKDEFTFYAPTAFSPGDDGLNDVFFITGSGINPSVFQLYIYDRWGEVVYQTNKFNPENNKQYGWDGRIKNRNFAETGTYTWYAVYKVTTGKEQQKSGSVTVIR